MEINTAMKAVQKAQEELDQKLEVLSTKHNTLDHTLGELEASVAKISDLVTKGPADHEREQGYKRAEAVNGQLDQMQETLRGLVSKINSLQEDDPDNPISKVAIVLNSHLSSLQWIEQQCLDLNGKIAQIEKLYSTQISYRS